MPRDAREPDFDAPDRDALGQDASDHDAPEQEAPAHEALAHEAPGHAALDHYSALGVPVDASQPQIAQAFRRQARTWHPDARPGDLEAPARFRAIVDAYQVLADPWRRARYDRARAASEQRAAARSAGPSGPASTAPQRQPSAQEPPPRSGRGRPIRVRYIRSGDNVGSAEGSAPIRPVDPRQAGQGSPHIRSVDPRQAGQGSPHTAPQRHREALADDPLLDLIGRLREFLYGRW
jgi:curved DNA-binding protein CbpA